MKHIGCKHLDYEENYINCELKTIEPEGWKYWYRHVVPYEEAPRNVQFCKKRGRVNGIFQCINEGEMSCYESQDGNEQG